MPILIFFFPACWQTEAIRCGVHEGSSWKGQHCPCDCQGWHPDTEGEGEAEEKSRSNTWSWEQSNPYNIKDKYKVIWNWKGVNYIGQGPNLGEVWGGKSSLRADVLCQLHLLRTWHVLGFMYLSKAVHPVTTLFVTRVQTEQKEVESESSGQSIP